MTNTRNLPVWHPGDALPVIDLLSGEIVTPTAEDYAEGYVIDGKCFALGQDNVLPRAQGQHHHPHDVAPWLARVRTVQPAMDRRRF